MRERREPDFAWQGTAAIAAGNLKGAMKADSTRKCSQAVPHPSTNWALRRLTSEVRRDPVHSTRYGRQQLSWPQGQYQDPELSAPDPGRLKVTSPPTSPSCSWSLLPCPLLGPDRGCSSFEERFRQDQLSVTGTRARNLRFRSPTPYPLGQGV